ncbi:MAG: hypothetical protein Q7S60_02395 [bacterium]|nr:hypothetical protein [bacterium]
MSSLEELTRDIEQIKQRNRLVERNKAWEASYTRRLLLITFTYVAIGFYLNAINVNRPWINAIVPAAGFLLSTLTLPFFKTLWETYIYKK